MINLRTLYRQAEAAVADARALLPILASIREGDTCPATLQKLSEAIQRRAAPSALAVICVDKLGFRSSPDASRAKDLGAVLGWLQTMCPEWEIAARKRGQVRPSTSAGVN